jgi:hypothetical protein
LFLARRCVDPGTKYVIVCLELEFSLFTLCIAVTGHEGGAVMVRNLIISFILYFLDINGLPLVSLEFGVSHALGQTPLSLELGFSLFTLSIKVTAMKVQSET